MAARAPVKHAHVAGEPCCFHSLDSHMTDSSSVHFPTGATQSIVEVCECCVFLIKKNYLSKAFVLSLESLIIV